MLESPLALPPENWLYRRMAPQQHLTDNEATDSYRVEDVLSPFKRDAWQRLSPGERLERSWRLRERLSDLAAIHDRKLFPKP